MLLNIKLYSNNIFSTRKLTTKQKKKIIIIDSKNITREQWKEFQEKVDDNLNKSNIDNLMEHYQQLKEILNNNMLTNQENREMIENRLKEIWTIFQDCLIRTAKAILSIKKIKSNS